MSRNTRSGSRLSIVVPLFNEAGTLEELHRRLTAVLFLLGIPSEIVYVDDGSSDGTAETLQGLESRDERVRVIRLARNYGQTAALAAGFDAAAGEVIVAMDGDLQHAPEEIPKLLAKLAEGYDIVSGWRAQRVDNVWTRRLPSKVANWLMAKLSGVSLHDFGTTFKAYRAPVIKQIRFTAILHRFIPALASWSGARIAEVPIANIPRPQSESHYGLSRTWRVAADLITVRFLLRYVTRPLHFFGPIGFASVAAGLAAGGWVVPPKSSGRAGVPLAWTPVAAQRRARPDRNRVDGTRPARGTADPHLHGRPEAPHLHRRPGRAQHVRGVGRSTPGSGFRTTRGGPVTRAAHRCGDGRDGRAAGGPARRPRHSGALRPSTSASRDTTTTSAHGFVRCSSSGSRATGSATRGDAPRGAGRSELFAADRDRSGAHAAAHQSMGLHRRGDPRCSSSAHGPHDRIG